MRGAVLTAFCGECRASIFRVSRNVYTSSIQTILGDKSNAVYPHKGSIKVLWETKWRAACVKSVYPFHDGRLEDFEPIFEKLIAQNINDAHSEQYTQSCLPASLEQRAATASSAGHDASTSTLLLRAAARVAFERQEEPYLRATAFWTPELEEHFIPHTHRTEKEKTYIPIYLRIPAHASAERKVSVTLLMTGLDGYRPDNSQRTHEIIRRGWGVVICEIPGTADSPADPADTASPDRLWIVAGGYYAVRAAHTHAASLVGCIAHGPGVHHFLDPEWLTKVEDHEYPFPILEAWAKKYGYEDPREFCQNAQGKFSLLENGVLENSSCRLLLLNGVDDGIVPIEDCLMLFNHGSPKEGWFYPGLPHMGYPDSLANAYKWLESLLGNSNGT
ncbi:alpha/beta-hydrolase [Aspergillus crustosus]